MNYKILQVLATLMSKTSFDQDGLNRFKLGGGGGGFNQGLTKPANPANNEQM